MARQTFHFMDFTGGYVSKGINPMAYPSNVVTGSSKNIEFSDQGIKTRKGTDYQFALSYPGYEGQEQPIIRRVKQVRFQRIPKRYTLVQASTVAGMSTYEDVYLSTLDLPTEGGAFAQPIIDLKPGDAESAGDISVACLVDRAIITDGEGSYPWVFMGGQEADASDWAFPKAVLVNQSGDRVYDISNKVCDDDVDSTALVASITSNGWIDIVCDVPNVKAFYFQVGTANGLDVSAIPSVAVTQTYNDSDLITPRNMQGTAVNWVQDATNTGHFENSSNTPVTLGAGNDCPLIEAGLLVVFADGSEVAIAAITDDGEGSGEVELDEAVTSQAVTAIYGVKVDGGKAMPTFGGNVWTPISTASSTYSYISREISAGDYLNYREVVSGARIGDQTHIRFVIGNPFSGTSEPPYVRLQANAYFGLRLSVDDFDGPPELVTFSGEDISQGSELASDALEFTTSSGSDYIFAFSVAAQTWTALI